MSTLSYILIFTFIASIGSLLGGILLLFNQKISLKSSHYLTAFAAGTMIATAFFDLLPEALRDAGEVNVLLWTLVGFLFLFVAERFIHFFHHHNYEEHEHKESSLVPLIIFSDSAHNFIDGVIIAAAFVVSIPLGIVTSLAIVAHEVPQEIGDFGILLKQGISRIKILGINILSAALALLGALVGYFIGESIHEILPIMLGLAAGFFLYISASDLIPEIHREHNNKTAWIETGCLLFGVLVIYLAINLLDQH